MRHGYILAIWGGTIQKVAARDTRYLPVTFKSQQNTKVSQYWDEKQKYYGETEFKAFNTKKR